MATQMVDDGAKIYSDSEIGELLGKDYILIHPSLYDHIPIGSHVRYFVTGDGPKNTRFRRGGFLTERFADADGVKRMRFGVSKFGSGPSKRSWTVPYGDLEQIWKKYCLDSYIEIHLISASLAEKKRQIEQLTANQAKLVELMADLKATVDKTRYKLDVMCANRF